MIFPLCHPLPLSNVVEDIELDVKKGALDIRVACKTTGKTGVEMEGLAGASLAALTVYDMCKALDKGMVISDLRLLEKTGGKSGDWRAES